MEIGRKESLDIVRKIAAQKVHTFHEHHHILLDLAEAFGEERINYVEIGCFEGASASLMMHRPNTNIISIDIGRPVSPDIAIQNIYKFNKYQNPYHYVKGRSTEQKVLTRVLELLRNQGIHILFIDGGHKYIDAMADFLMYGTLVNRGGFVVIDDYRAPSCPEVPVAVDDIVRYASREFEIYGSLDNEVGAAFPNPLIQESNEFILRKNR